MPKLLPPRAKYTSQTQTVSQPTGLTSISNQNQSSATGIMSEDQEEDDICPVCESECTCLNRRSYQNNTTNNGIAAHAYGYGSGPQTHNGNGYAHNAVHAQNHDHAVPEHQNQYQKPSLPITAENGASGTRPSLKIKITLPPSYHQKVLQQQQQQNGTEKASSSKRHRETTSGSANAGGIASTHESSSYSGSKKTQQEASTNSNSPFSAPGQPLLTGLGHNSGHHYGNGPGDVVNTSGNAISAVSADADASGQVQIALTQLRPLPALPLPKKRGRPTKAAIAARERAAALALEAAANVNGAGSVGLGNSAAGVVTGSRNTVNSNVSSPTIASRENSHAVVHAKAHVSSTTTPTPTPSSKPKPKPTPKPAPTSTPTTSARYDAALLEQQHLARIGAVSAVGLRRSLLSGSSSPVNVSSPPAVRSPAIGAVTSGSGAGMRERERKMPREKKGTAGASSASGATSQAVGVTVGVGGRKQTQTQTRVRSQKNLKLKEGAKPKAATTRKDAKSNNAAAYFSSDEESVLTELEEDGNERDNEDNDGEEDNEDAESVQFPTFISAVSSSSSSGEDEDESESESSDSEGDTEGVGEKGNRWEIRPRKKSVGVGDVTEEEDDDEEDDEDEEDEEEEEEEGATLTLDVHTSHDDDMEMEMDIDPSYLAGYHPLSYSWSEIEEDEDEDEDAESSFDADLFFANLSDSGSEMSERYVRSGDVSEEDSFERDVANANSEERSALDALDALAGMMLPLPLPLHEWDWDASVGAGVGVGLVDLDFEVSVVDAQAQAQARARGRDRREELRNGESVSSSRMTSANVSEDEGARRGRVTSGRRRKGFHEEESLPDSATNSGLDIPDSPFQYNTDSDLDSLNSADDSDLGDPLDDMCGSDGGDTTEDELVDLDGVLTPRNRILLRFPASMVAVEPLKTISRSNSLGAGQRDKKGKGARRGGAGAGADRAGGRGRKDAGVAPSSPSPADILAGRFSFGFDSVMSEPGSGLRSARMKTPERDSGNGRGRWPIMGSFEHADKDASPSNNLSAKPDNAATSVLNSSTTAPVIDSTTVTPATSPKSTSKPKRKTLMMIITESTPVSTIPSPFRGGSGSRRMRRNRRGAASMSGSGSDFGSAFGSKRGSRSGSEILPMNLGHTHTRQNSLLRESFSPYQSMLGDDFGVANAIGNSLEDNILVDEDGMHMHHLHSRIESDAEAVQPIQLDDVLDAAFLESEPHSLEIENPSVVSVDGVSEAGKVDPVLSSSTTNGSTLSAGQTQDAEMFSSTATDTAATASSGASNNVLPALSALADSSRWERFPMDYFRRSRGQGGFVEDAKIDSASAMNLNGLQWANSNAAMLQSVRPSQRAADGFSYGSSSSAVPGAGGLLRSGGSGFSAIWDVSRDAERSSKGGKAGKKSVSKSGGMMSVIISPVLIPIRDRDVVMDGSSSPSNGHNHNYKRNRHKHQTQYNNPFGFNVRSRKELRNEKKRSKKLARVNSRQMHMQRGHYPNSKARSTSSMQRAWYSSPTHGSNVPHLSI